MESHVYWILELNVQPGRESKFRGLMAEMVEATRENEPGTLNYEWNTNSDGSVCHIYERYVDSAAVMTHLASFNSKFAQRFMEVLKPIRFAVYGQPAEEVREALAGFSPTYMTAAKGFARL
jgi:quinol monooxygenase YgiN